MFVLMAATLLVAGLILYVVHILRPTGAGDTDTSLDAFVSSGPKEPSTSNEAASQGKWTRYCSPGKIRQLLIMFATEYGFGEELATKLAERVWSQFGQSDQSWQARVVSAGRHDHVTWDQETVCFFIISTCGDGVAPTESRSFMTFLESSQHALQDLCVSVLALGDRSYPHFCQAGIMLQHSLTQQGANHVVAMTRVDGEDWVAIDNWMDQLLAWLQSAQALSITSPSLDYLDTAALDTHSASWSRHNPFMATLVVKRLLTQVRDKLVDRETIHCELDLTGSGLTWTPGDSVGIWPTNNPDTVDRLLSLLRLTGQEQLSLQKPAFRGHGSVTIRQAYLCCYDLHNIRPTALTALRESLPCCQPDLCHLHKSYSSRETCRLEHVFDNCCLGDQPLAPSLAAVVAMTMSLRPLQPRFYSISSSPLMAEDTVSLTMAVVRYVVAGRQEEGVTTTHIQDRLTEGETIPIFINVNPNFRLPCDLTTPIILIGAGTGLAPYRAFIQHQESVGIEKGNIHLYFGCRHPDKDFLYRTQLEGWAASGFIRLRAALSRYNSRRVYIQDLLTEDALQIWTLIDKHTAAVYVCGDGHHMAHDVHNSLLTIIQHQGLFSQVEASDYLRCVEQQGRYQRDVW